jgi:hypothetical protein
VVVAIDDLPDEFREVLRRPLGLCSGEHVMMEAMGMMPCEHVLDRLWEYLDDELTPDDETKVTQHLEICNRCYPEWPIALPRSAWARAGASLVREVRAVVGSTRTLRGPRTWRGSTTASWARRSMSLDVQIDGSVPVSELNERFHLSLPETI